MSVLRYLQESLNNIPLSFGDVRSIAKDFKNSKTEDELSRGFCGKIADEFKVYMKDNYQTDVNVIRGYFYVDEPTTEASDFTKDELEMADEQGYYASDKDEMWEFASNNGLLERLKYVPHVWNIYDNKIIDLTGAVQFLEVNLSIGSPMSPDLDKDRYFLPQDTPHEASTRDVWGCKLHNK